jgi:tetratricopeptide (TPR) repeat protein
VRSRREAFHFRAGIGATQIHVRMAMDIRQIREHLGRVKAYYLKNETLRSMDALINGLKGALTLPGGLPTNVRSPLREAVQLVAKEDLVKKRVPAATPLMYQQGQERQLLAVLMDLRKEIDEDLNSEDYETAAARKLRLDQALNQGLRSLEAGRVSEADEYFQQALANYRDEHRVFFYIGTSLVEANAAKRAMPYLRKGVAAAPDDEEMAAMLETANQAIKAAAE